MKRVMYGLIAALMGIPIMFGSTAARATMLFSDNFEGDLSAWTGKYGGAHSGEIVVDPLDPTNRALHFTDFNSEGDIYTVESFTSKIDLFRLEFDYLGDLSQGGDSLDLGGFVGFTTVDPGLGVENQMTLQWLAGSMENYPLSIMTLPDTGSWVHVEIWFPSADPISLVVEDYMKATGIAIAGDAYFDNIELNTPYTWGQFLDSPNPTPEPATMLLMGSGLLGLASFRKRRKEK